MKFGEALPLRSVQEWLSYNIDYTEIKQLIKHYTTARPPVSSPEQKTEFEDELFEVFLDQLSRIDLFVKSKTGEVDRRIASCKRQIVELRRRTAPIRNPSRISNRYAKIEQEVERAGHDVQSLSRFVNVQRTGLHKLLKKYRKWTGSATLPERFLVLLESPTAFHRRDFDRDVLEVSELLKAVREGINSLSGEAPPPLTWQPSRPPSEHRVSFSCSTFSSLQCVAAGDIPLGRRLDLDVAFGTSRITTDHGSRAVFWVHHDYLIELQVFLLRHLTLQPSTPFPSVPPTPLVSRRNSMAGTSGGDDVGLVVLDNLESFSDVQSTATIDTISRSAMRTAGQIRWCARDAFAAVVVLDHPGAILDPHHARDEQPLLETKVKRKLVESLLDPATELSRLYDDHQSARQRRDIERVREWFAARPGVVPLAKILARRTRFSGPVAGGEAWAFLDRDVRMLPNPGSAGWLVADDDDAARPREFPHAVLEIQWDGSQTPDFIHELAESHMVENVPGFSLDVHAIATLYEPKDMSPPFWLPALSKDIRKTPSTRPATSRRNSSRVVFSGPSSKSSSIGAVGSMSGLADQFSTPATSDGAMAAGRKKRKRTSRNTMREVKPLANESYWNEFDDDDREEPYTVLVRPSTAGSLDDGDDEQQSLSAFMLGPIARLFARTVHGGRRHASDEFPPLLMGGDQTEVDSESESDTEAGGRGSGSAAPPPPRRLPAAGDYATFSRPVGAVAAAAAAVGAHHLVFLAIASVLVVVTGVLALGEALAGGDGLDGSRQSQRLHQHIGEHIAINLGVFVGVLASLALAAIGLMVFLVRGASRRASLLHRAYVWTTFVVVCAGSGAILTMVATTEAPP